MVRITSMELAMFFIMNGVKGYWLFTGEGSKRRLVYDFDVKAAEARKLEAEFRGSPVGKFLKAKKKLERRKTQCPRRK